MDKGYDHNRVMHDSRERGCIPIVALCRGAQSRSALAAVATVAVIVWLVIAGWSFGGY